jgi:hypothetical protein
MKTITILLSFLFLLPIISTVEFDMKANFSQGETFMAKVSGNFLEPILRENILFYRGHVRVPMNSHVTRINDEFYIYAQLLGKAPDNYSIAIENVRYMKAGQISEEDLVKDFSITENTADFSIVPGFVITEGDFFIEAQNLQDHEIAIKIKTDISPKPSKGFFESLFGIGDTEEENLTILKSGEIKKINFEFKNITESTLKIIELSTENLKYSIPVYIFASENKTELEEKQRNFKFELTGLNVSMSTNSNTSRIIYIHNTGEETLENISLSISDSLKPYVSLSIKEINELKENSSVKIELYLSSDYDKKKIEGQITAKTEGLYTYLAVFLNFLKDYVPDKEEIPAAKTCSELEGKICNEDEKCDEDLVYAKDDVCCLGTCEKVEKSSTGKIIGWGMVVVIVVFLIWFFKAKYRGVKRTVDLFKISKGKR